MYRYNTIQYNTIANHIYSVFKASFSICVCIILYYIIVRVGYGPAFGDDWPLSETDISRLDINRESLVELLDTSDLCNRLFSEKVINFRKKQFILSKTTDAEKNEALLDMLTKFSLRQYKETIACLNNSNQSHIADLFSEEGGGELSFKSNSGILMGNYM